MGGIIPTRDIGRSRKSFEDLDVAPCCEVLEEGWVEDELKGHGSEEGRECAPPFPA
jgi:hypothetical protein